VTPAELTSAEEVLERKGWTLISREFVGLGWSATIVTRAFRYHQIAPTRHQARSVVVQMALETQGIVDSHSDTMRAPPMTEGQAAE
jgi:hypothetical protein